MKKLVMGLTLIASMSVMASIPTKVKNISEEVILSSFSFGVECPYGQNEKVITSSTSLTKSTFKKELQTEEHYVIMARLLDEYSFYIDSSVTNTRVLFKSGEDAGSPVKVHVYYCEAGNIKK